MRRRSHFSTPACARSYSYRGVSVEAIDTTGPGDMYAAGVIYGITNGKQAEHLGSHAAARIVSQLVARLGRRFTPEEIRTLLT